MRPWYYAAIARCAMLAAALSSVTGTTPAAAQAGGGPVCVFEHINFSGRQLCFGPGQSVPSIRSYGDFWNDRISSIAVTPGYVVRACQHDGFQGRCSTYDRSISNLVSQGFNDEISSLSIAAQGLGPGGPGRSLGGPGGPGSPGFGRDYMREEMFALRRACDAGDRRACIQFGIIIGENREQWRRDNPDLFWWER